MGRKRILWTANQWNNVMFSDELTFNLQNDSRYVTWREPGLRCNPTFICEFRQHGKDNDAVLRSMDTCL